MKDLSAGSGTFLRMGADPLRLAHNQLINIGESYIIINLSEEHPSTHSDHSSDENTASDESIHRDVDTKKPKQVMLRLKTFGGPSTGEPYSFNPL